MECNVREHPCRLFFPCEQVCVSDNLSPEPACLSTQIFILLNLRAVNCIFVLIKGLFVQVFDYLFEDGVHKLVHVLL